MNASTTPITANVLIRCTYRWCRDGKIGVGRYCPDCGGTGSMVVPREFAVVQGYEILEARP